MHLYHEHQKKKHEQDLDQMEKQNADRFNEGKIDFTYIDPTALAGLSQVLMFGAEKYSRDNWRKGMPYQAVLASMLRHVYAILDGEDIDSESGLPHIDHLGCNWMFLSNYMKTRPDLDDRRNNESN